jgi:hypothetical protein
MFASAVYRLSNDEKSTGTTCHPSVHLVRRRAGAEVGQVVRPLVALRLDIAPNHPSECVQFAIGLLQHSDDIAQPAPLLCGMLGDHR